MSRWALRRLAALLLVLAAAAFAAPAWLYLLPFIDSPGSPEGATYYSAILGALSLVLALAALASSLTRSDSDPVATLHVKGLQASGQRMRDLRGNTTSDDLYLRLRSASGLDSDVSQVAATLSERGRIVVLGRRGAGKTFTLQQMCMRVMQSNPEAIAIVIPVERWTVGQNMHDWLVDYLSREFTAPRQLVESLFLTRRILVAFDGLDEAIKAGVNDEDPPDAQLAESFLHSLFAWSEQGERATWLLSSQAAAWRTLTLEVRVPEGCQVFRIRAVDRDDATRYMMQGMSPRTTTESANSVLDAVRGELWVHAWGLAMLTSIAHRRCQADGTVSESSLSYMRTLTLTDLVSEYIQESTRFSGLFNRWRQRRLRRQLCFFADYLVANEKLERRVAGKRLSGQDIELHRLWPIGGTIAPRVVDFLLCVLMSAPGLAWFDFYAWHTNRLLGTAVLVLNVPYAALLVRTSTKAWVAPASSDWSRLKEPRLYLSQIAAASVGGALAWLLFSPIMGAVVFVTAWLAIGFTVGFGQTLTTNSQLELLGPYTVLRRERNLSLVCGAIAFPTIAFAFSRTWGNFVGPLLALIYCGVVGLTVASALWRRYFALILTSSRSIGLQPNRLLSSAVKRGLIRSAGLAYQFRHIEVRNALSVKGGVRGLGEPPGQ